MLQLFPERITDVEPAEVVISPWRAPVGSRPWVLTNMVTSLDGAATVEGRSGHLGGPDDREVFLELRGVADVVLVGAGTVRAERYGPVRLTAASKERRATEGRDDPPRLAVVSTSLDLDPELPLFTGPRPLVLTSRRADPVRRALLEEVADVIDVGAEHAEPAPMLDALRDLGASIVLCEGGPTLLGHFHEADLIDEWCVTVGAVATSGIAPRIAVGSTQVARPLRLDAVWESDGVLFLRHRRHRS